QEAGERFGAAGGLRLARMPYGLGQMQARPRFQHIADDQPDGQRDGGHHHEVGQRQPADRADLGGLTDRADAQHDGAEDDGRDHHLDEVHEPGAERFELDGDTGGGESHDDAEQYGADHG